MRRETAMLSEIYLLGLHTPAGRVRCTQAMTPAPGQFVMAILRGDNATHRIPLFPSSIHADGFSSTMLPERWRPGDQLDLLGPFGTGFSPPGSARRWLVASTLERCHTLQPLIEAGLERDLELAYWGQGIPALDPSVEIIVELEDGLEWADYAACETGRGTLTALDAIWSGSEHRAEIQVLLISDLVCGFGACQACATAHARGYKLACVDGPVFEAHELDPR
jgi:hypothetical protein